MTERVVPETFTDGVGRYRFGGGVVRNDVMSATEAPEGEQEAQTTSPPADSVTREVYENRLGHEHPAQPAGQCRVVRQGRRQEPDDHGNGRLDRGRWIPKSMFHLNTMSEQVRW